VTNQAVLVSGQEAQSPALNQIRESARHLRGRRQRVPRITTNLKVSQRFSFERLLPDDGPGGLHTVGQGAGKAGRIRVFAYLHGAGITLN